MAHGETMATTARIMVALRHEPPAEPTRVYLADFFGHVRRTLILEESTYSALR